MSEPNPILPTDLRAAILELLGEELAVELDVVDVTGPGGPCEVSVNLYLDGKIISSSRNWID